MKQLFFSRDAGVGPILLSENGRRRLPAFHGTICRLLDTVESLTAANHFMANDTAADRQRKDALEDLTIKTANYLVEQLETVVGELDRNNAIVFEGKTNGFVCGADGKVPRYIGRDVLQSTNVETIISSGVIDEDMIAFVDAANAQGADWVSALETPKELAKELGVSISEKTAADMHMLAPSQLEKIPDPVAREYIAFFHAVMKDGRYLAIWHSRPAEVAENLGIKLSQEVLEKSLMLSEEGSCENPDKDAGVGVVAVAIMLCIVVTIAWDKAVVKDRSGVEKL